MNRFIKTSISSVMIAGTLFAGMQGASASSKEGDFLHNVGTNMQTSQSHSSLDLAIVNDDKLIESFIKRGLLSKNTSQAEKQKFLKNYLEVKGTKFWCERK